MPTFRGQVSEEDLMQLLAYLKTLAPAAGATSAAAAPARPIQRAGLTLEQEGGDGGAAEGIKGRKVANLEAQGDDSRSGPDQPIGRMASRVQGGIRHGYPLLDRLLARRTGPSLGILLRQARHSSQLRVT